jgi:HTH-type transcriptional regulator/antitoxin HigA
MVYQPNKAIHPGISVQRELNHLGMSQKRLAERTGLSEKHISQIINGEASITADTAFLFANALGGTASFWLNLDRNYRETLARIEQEQKASEEVIELANFPYNDLAKLGRVEKTSNKVERVINLWKFFGVNSFDAIQQTEAVAYRRGYGAGVKQGALAAWLRCGELDAKNLRLGEYSESNLRSFLPQIRQLTQMLDKEWWAKLQGLLSNAGVGLVAAQHLTGTQAHGATRWIGGSPIIQLSARGKDADKMWFTLFHEIGHVFLHGKKDQFISFNKSIRSPQEDEADAFAAKTLIPETDYMTFVIKQDFSEQAIRAFAQAQGVHTGTVVGRLKKENLVPYTQFQHLHAKLTIKE